MQSFKHVIIDSDRILQDSDLLVGEVLLKDHDNLCSIIKKDGWPDTITLMNTGYSPKALADYVRARVSPASKDYPTQDPVVFHTVNDVKGDHSCVIHPAGNVERWNPSGR